MKRIFEYYRKYNYPTIVMGASFRNKGEILSLAGCDKLTIGPKFLAELEACTDDCLRKLEGKPGSPRLKKPEKMDELNFRWQFNEDAMAVEKLSEGIRNFNKDFEKLKHLVVEKYL